MEQQVEKTIPPFVFTPKEPADHTRMLNYQDGAFAENATLRAQAMIMDALDEYWRARGELSLINRNDYIIQTTTPVVEPGGLAACFFGYREILFDTLLVNKTTKRNIAIKLSSVSQHGNFDFFESYTEVEGKVVSNSLEFKCNSSIHIFTNAIFIGQLYNYLTSGELDIELKFSIPNYH